MSRGDIVVGLGIGSAVLVGGGRCRRRLQLPPKHVSGRGNRIHKSGLERQSSFVHAT